MTLHRREHDDYFVLWTPMGFVLGASLMGVAYTIAGPEATANWLLSFQSLVGAVIAVFTAAWVVIATVKASNREIEASVASTNEQIQSTRNLEYARRNQGLRARRTVLPFALIKIADYCDETAVELRDFLDRSGLDNRLDPPSFVVTGSLSVPKFPDGVLDKVTNVLEMAPDEIAAELGALLVEIQLCDSRLRKLEENAHTLEAPITRRQVKRRILDVCALNARSSRYFKYGRLQSESVRYGPVTQEEVFSSATLLLWGYVDEELFDLMKQFPTSESRSYADTAEY